MFTVDRIEYTGSREFMIGGRNCGDKPLRKSDRLIVTKDGQPTATALAIVRIVFYGREADEVDPGHTAGLFFRMGPERLISLGDSLVPSREESTT